MRKTIITVSLILLLSACGGEDADPTTTTTAAAATGVDAVRSCVETIHQLTAGIDPNAEDAVDQLDEALGFDAPADCWFFDEEDPPASLGLTADEFMVTLEDTMDPVIFDLMFGPRYEPFEHTVDEL